MTSPRGLVLATFVVALGLGAPLRAQIVIANPNFEAGPRDSIPVGWFARPPAGYRVVVTDSGALQGRQALLLDGSSGASGFASVVQRLDATPFRGQRIRYRAWVRAQLTGTGAWDGLWLRVDREGRQVGFFDNMQDRSIVSPAWALYEITGDVADDATAIVYGALLAGEGRMWIDSVTIEMLPPLNAADLAPPSPAALAYLDSALNIMQTHSINRARIDWTTFRARAHARVAGAEHPAQTYSAIRQSLSELGDHHSFFMMPSTSAGFTSGGGTFPDTNARLVENRFGYLRIPAYSGGDSLAIQHFAGQMQEAIRRLDGPRTCGWIVDLRGNTGGNMWPMLAGIGPVMGNGVAGSFVGPGSAPVNWAYQDGAMTLGAGTLVAAPRDPYQLRRPGSPVAVLYDSLTASSGEAVAISFRGLPNTRSFGTVTAGLSTANENYDLPDGAMILLTNSIEADRTGTTYGERLTPDELIAKDPGSDAALSAAVRWLGTRCR